MRRFPICAVTETDCREVLEKLKTWDTLSEGVKTGLLAAVDRWIRWDEEDYTRKRRERSTNSAIKTSSGNNITVTESRSRIHTLWQPSGNVESQTSHLDF